ncbi:MAG: hypothetical protein QXE64_02655 [Candidatus Pacearchaeota archaeon]
MSRKNKLLLLSAIIGLILAVSVIAIIFSFRHPAAIAEKTRIKAEYAIYADGKLYETEQISFYEGELSRKLGLASDKLDQVLDQMLVNKSDEGDKEFNISLSPEEAYGSYDESLRRVVDRTIKQSRFNEIELSGTITKDQFIQAFGQEPLVNQSYVTAGLIFPIKVISVSDVVKFELDVKPGDVSRKDQFGFWLEVVEINRANNSVKLKLNGNATQIPSQFGLIDVSFDSENVYYKLNPIIGEELMWQNEEGIVVSFNETSIVLDRNHPLAGKPIIVNIKILSKEAMKAVAGAVMDVFIMSYCPYGLQIVKGLLPVWKAFEDKANITVRFVSYTMHGQKEADENARMACIREEQSNKYMDYLECFVESGNAQECLEKVGIDKAKLNSCITERAKSYLAYDAELNERYGVKGSPTVVINGEQVEIWPRSPANIASKLCEYFSEKPQECSMSFSKENPSPGFGSKQTSSSGGSCGG